MAKCPDCDSIKILRDEGDGKCDYCHGDGYGGMLDRVVGGLVGEEPECWKCHGTGMCQTCGGTGVVDDDE